MSAAAATPAWRPVAAWTAALIVLSVGVFSVRDGLLTAGLDFRSAVWAPGRALLTGHDPYRPGAVEHVDATVSPFPLYGPVHLLVAAIFALVPKSIAAPIWKAVVVAVLGLSAAWAVRVADPPHRWAWTVALFGLILASRPGRNMVSLGQPSALYIPLVWLIWRRRDDGALPVLVLALLGGKPPFSLPVLVLLLFERCWLLVGRALATSLLLSGPVLLALVAAAGGPQVVISDVRANVRALSAFDESRNLQRIDLLALGHRAVGGSVGTALVVATVFALGWLLIRSTPQPADRAMRILGFALLSLLAVRHVDYDAFLLMVPLAAVVGESARDTGARVAVLACAPAVLATFVPIRTAVRATGVAYGVFETLTTLTMAAALLVVVSLAVHRSRGGSVKPKPAPEGVGKQSMEAPPGDAGRSPT